MTAQPPDKLLSAWLDGEASLEERQLVEQWLAASDEARQELDELRRLSTLIRALPISRAPSDMASTVLLRAERAMLLPDPAVTAPPPRRTRAGGWAAVTLGLAATVALVLVTTGIFGPTSPLTQPQSESAYNELSAPHADRSVVNRPGSPAIAAVENAGEAGLERSVNAVSDHAPAPASASHAAPLVASKQETANSSAGRAAASPLEVRRGSSPDSGSDAQFQPMNAARPLAATMRQRSAMSADAVRDGNAANESRALQAAIRAQVGHPLAPGEVVRYLDASGEAVTVVEVTVVDVDRAVGQLRYLLAKAPAASEPESQRAALADDAASPPPRLPADNSQPTELAVYVEANSDQLASVLKSISADYHAQLTLQQSIAPEQVEVAEVDYEPSLPAAQQRRTAPRQSLKAYESQRHALAQNREQMSRANFGKRQLDQEKSTAPQPAAPEPTVSEPATPKAVGAELPPAPPTLLADTMQAGSTDALAMAVSPPLVLDIVSPSAASLSPEATDKDRADRVEPEENRRTAEAKPAQHDERPATDLAARKSGAPHSRAASPEHPAEPVRVILVFRGTARTVEQPLPN